MTRRSAPVYLLGDVGLAALNRFIDPSTLYAFDLDGTLAPIVDDPASIEVSDAIVSELEKLQRKAALGIITGRSRRDAQQHLGIVPDYLIGNHGLEGLPGWENRQEEFRNLGLAWEKQLQDLLTGAPNPGVIVENKGPSLSIHYRNAPQKTAARTQVRRAVDRLEPRPRLMYGKYVLNLLPDGAPDKGTAILDLMRRAGHSKGFFVGDDVTDEDVFRLTGNNLFTVLIGNRPQSKAHYFLKDQQEILRLLREINMRLA